jgi:hypothetical protein
MNQRRSSPQIKTSKAPVPDGPTFDQIMDDLHATRQALLAQFGNDVGRLLEHLSTQSKAHPKKLRRKPHPSAA